SVIITNLSVHEKIETFVNTGICDNESYFAGGDWQSETGTYYDSLTTVYGCDSIVITNLSVYETYESVNNADICEGESYFAGGDRQTKPGTYYDNHTSIHGCDSTIITNLSVNNRYVISRDTTICEGNMVYVGGSWRKDPGTYYDSLTTVYSCDSIIITTLNIEVCTNIEVIQEDIGVIYPIPTSGMVYIQYPDFKYVEVFTISGIKLMKTQDNRIDLSGYNEGIYLFRIYNNEDKFFIRKVQLILNQ
ncbi:MAG: T9SS type A sorting domain-containing protein, partial [Bacteroidales bacterium]|nr:T9SS type A sorting domain-containing protein [Bacteroidales bacterium]